MTSIDDVAREVGMSTATVSRALRGLPRVSQATRDRVIETAQRLGYVPSPHAASLASGRTGTIAIVVPFVTRWFFAMVVDGAEQVLRAQGFDVLLYNLAGDAGTRHRVLQTHVLTKRVDAVLVLGLSPTPLEVDWLTQQKCPVVILGAEVPQWPSVRIDDEVVARTAVGHLIDLGHRRIGYVGSLVDEGLDFATPRARRLAYQEMLAEHGIEHDPVLETEGHFTLGGGREAGHALLDLPERPSAVFCASDEMAIGVLRASRERGVRVPEDWSVIGIDDHEMAPYFDLTTVRQPVSEEGAVAGRHILRCLGVATIEEPEHVVLPTELVVRGTTAEIGLSALPTRG